MKKPLLIIGSLSFITLVFEVLITRIFSIVLFGPQADLAVSLAILGIGIGAVFSHYASHRSDVHLLSLIPGIVGVLIIAVVSIILNIPLTLQNETPPETFQERSHLLYGIVNTPSVAFSVILLLIPFTLSGYGIASVLNYAKEKVGVVYAFDLICGAIGVCLGYLLLSYIATPDVVFVCAAVGAVVSVILIERWKVWRVFFLAVAAASIIAIFSSSTEHGLLKVKYASGYSERTIVYSDWSPLSRVAIHKSAKTGDEAVVLDNASASPVTITSERIQSMRGTAPRGLVYTLVKNCQNAAIIGASAGPEVGVAHLRGCNSIQAIDIVGKIFEVVEKRYQTPLNPYTYPEVQKIGLDGRTAILLSPEKFDVIQMVHANLWSTAGIISNVWTHSYLETEEAFRIYLSKLTPDGILSFARGIDTSRLYQAAISSLRKEHPDNYWRYALATGGQANILLLRPRPWTVEEVKQVEEIAKNRSFGKITIANNPLSDRPPGDAPGVQEYHYALTDDKPFTDSEIVWTNFVRWIAGVNSMFNDVSAENASFAFIYSILVVQFGVVLLVGAVLLLLPCFVHRAHNTFTLKQAVPSLLFAFFVGYGFMAIELVSLNKAVLYLGDPTFAASLIIGTFLVGSGLGSLYWARSTRIAWWPSVIISLLAYGTFRILTLLPECYPHASLLIRGSIVALALFPLSFLMGQPFSQVLKAINFRWSGLGPWAFAMNTWSSVLAGFGTTIVARFYGYHYSGLIGLVCYLFCAVIIATLLKSTTNEA